MRCNKPTTTHSLSTHPPTPSQSAHLSVRQSASDDWRGLGSNVHTLHHYSSYSTVTQESYTAWHCDHCEHRIEIYSPSTGTYRSESCCTLPQSLCEPTQRSHISSLPFSPQSRVLTLLCAQRGWLTANFCENGRLQTSSDLTTLTRWAGSRVRTYSEAGVLVGKQEGKYHENISIAPSDCRRNLASKLAIVE